MNEQLYDTDNQRTLISLANVADCLHALGKDSEALTYAERADEMSARTLSEDHPRRKGCIIRLQKIREALAKAESPAKH